MTFADVKENDYYYEPVRWAVEKGLTAGLSETEFDRDGKPVKAYGSATLIVD